MSRLELREFRYSRLALAGNWLQRLNSSRQTLQFVFNARLRHFRFALVKFSCLLIRGTARSILKAQHFIRQDRYGMQDFRTTNAPHSVSASPHRPWQPPPLSSRPKLLSTKRPSSISQFATLTPAQTPGLASIHQIGRHPFTGSPLHERPCGLGQWFCPAVCEVHHFAGYVLSHVS